VTYKVNTKDKVVFITIDDGFYVIQIPKTYSIYISWKKKDIDKIKNKREGFITLNNNGFFDNLPVNANALKK
jgi:stalled ribosome rescue protein Dom34